MPIVDWVNEELLGKNRVSFDTQLSPAMLKIRNVSLEDAGLYRYRNKTLMSGLDKKHTKIPPPFYGLVQTFTEGN